MEPFRFKSDLRNHQAIVQPRNDHRASDRHGDKREAKQRAIYLKVTGTRLRLRLLARQAEDASPGPAKVGSLAPSEPEAPLHLLGLLDPQAVQLNLNLKLRGPGNFPIIIAPSKNKTLMGLTY